jgi:DNA ligase (NAD+)
MNSTIVYIPFIQKCPICGGDITYITDPLTKVERAWCLNEDCQGRSINRIDHFFGKKGLNVKGLSKATIGKLIDWGWAEDIPDIFTLASHRSEWIKKTGFGVKSVDNILAAVDAGRYTTLAQIISAAGIPKIGMNVALKLAGVCPDWELFVDSAKNGSFYKLDGIGPELVNYLKNYDYSWLDKLIKDGILIIKENEQESPHEQTNTLNNQSIVITGKLTIFKKRADLENFIKDNGGTIGGAISGKTTILINNDNTSTSKKNQDAKAKGIPIMTEQEFLDKFSLSAP